MAGGVAQAAGIDIIRLLCPEGPPAPAFRAQVAVTAQAGGRSRAVLAQFSTGKAEGWNVCKEVGECAVSQANAVEPVQSLRAARERFAPAKVAYSEASSNQQVR